MFVVWNVIVASPLLSVVVCAMVVNSVSSGFLVCM